jgi:hypothetical protein
LASNRKVLVIAHGDRTDLESFLKDLNDNYSLVLASSVMRNSRPSDRYPFRIMVTVDVSTGIDHKGQL